MTYEDPTISKKNQHLKRHGATIVMKKMDMINSSSFLTI